MTLINKILDSIAIRFKLLNTQEYALSMFLKTGHKLLDSAYLPGDIHWKIWDDMTYRIPVILENYNGRFKNYFERSFESLKEKERILLGYY